MNNHLRAAARYAALGLPVLPLEPAGKAPLGRLVRRGVKDATTDPATLRRWWQSTRDANVGVACGHPLPGGGVLAVLDVDPRDSGDLTLDALLAKNGARLPLGPEVRTGGDGWHHYFSAPAGTRCAKLGPGLDLKATGGYVVAAPSLHPTGNVYAWHRDRGLDDLGSLPALPSWAIPAPPRPRSAVRPRQDRDDPLLEIPAAEYVAALTGRRPDARGYVQCPFHKGGEERTPSLYLYDDGGWFCFGCRTGGSIYTLAGLVGGYPTPLRGAAFLTVQATLYDHFGAKAAA
jgi:hypothetical protein